MKNFFTADPHFGHDNIIKYCGRNFENTYYMDKYIIDKWNEVTTEKDNIYILGDMIWPRVSIHNVIDLVKKFKAHIKLIPGSHDSDKHIKIMKAVGIEILDSLYTLNSNGNVLVLCHYPLSIWPRSHYNSICLHGHCHGMHNQPGKIMDVGVDCFNYELVREEYIIEKFKDIDNPNLVKKRNG